MNRWLKKFKGKGRALFCLLLAWSLITCALCVDKMTVTASGAELTFDIGVNAESVTAVLDDTGLLTISGSGAIRDFTPETAPFAGKSVRAVRMSADLAAIGSYTFYNCGELTSALTLPAKLIRIGDGAFSGESLEKAPRPAFVENHFTQSLVTRKKEAAPSDEDTSSVPNEGESQYTVETITQQEIGAGIFFPRTDSPAFLCASENQTFRSAMETAGYREAQQMLSVTFAGGAEEETVTKNLPVVEGNLILPELPQELSAPQGGELFSYAFSGWTEAEDEPGMVRSPGSSFAVNNRTELYFIAGWARTVKATLEVKRTETGVSFTVPELPNYDVTAYRWETRRNSSDWEVVPEETEQSLLLPAMPADGQLFRCVVTVKEQQGFFQTLFSASSEEEIIFPAAEGLNHTASAVLTAAKSGSGTAEAQFSLPVSSGDTTYRITEMQCEGTFSLVLPGENGALAFTGTQNAGNTFALRAVSADSEAHLLTALPEGEESWNSGVSGVWNSGEGTFAIGNEVAFALMYDPSFENFSGGTVELTLGEYDEEENLQNQTVVTLTLEEQGSVTQTACTAAGRSFEASPGTGTAVIDGGGAVTAWFVSEYTPSEPSARGMELSLWKAGDTPSPAQFPQGTRIVLADQTAAGQYRYYSVQCSGQETVSLSAFTGQSGAFSGTAEAGKRFTEKLLFAVSFSGTAMPQGSYFLTLSHGEETASTARAGFTVENAGNPAVLLEQGSSVSGTLWNASITPQISGTDRRYDAGCLITLNLLKEDGTAVAFPKEVILSGGESPAFGSTGSLSFYLAKAGGQITLDFSNLPEAVLPDGNYQLSASLSPRPGLQSPGAAKAVSQKLLFELKRSTEEEIQRALGVSLSAGNRLLEATGEDSLTLSIAYENIQEGDTLEAELLQKAGDSPDEGSYLSLGSAVVWGASLPESMAESGECSLTITVPGEQKSGTYRILVKIKDAAGNTVAEEPYNFIVK